jgi:hypothetical protein
MKRGADRVLKVAAICDLGTEIGKRPECMDDLTAAAFLRLARFGSRV